MKKFLVASLLAVSGVALGQQSAAPPAGAPGDKPVTKEKVNFPKLQQTLGNTRRQLFSAGMSNLSASDLQTFWAVYADFEKEKDAQMSKRMELLQQYVDNFTTLTDADVTKMVTAANDLQKEGADLRMKYFGILSQKINPKTAGRFAHIDDYLTTAWRLSILDNIPALDGGSAPAKN
jgi:hypothetical protein